MSEKKHGCAWCSNQKDFRCRINTKFHMDKDMKRLGMKKLSDFIPDYWIRLRQKMYFGCECTHFTTKECVVFT